METPSGEGSRLGLDDVGGSKDGHSQAIALHSLGLEDVSLPINERNVDRKLHAKGMDPIARGDDECTRK